MRFSEQSAAALEFGGAHQGSFCDEAIFQTARSLEDHLTDPRVTFDCNATVRQADGCDQLIEHDAGGTARQIDRKGVAAEVADDAGDIQATTTRMIFFATGADLVDRSDGFRLAESVDGGVQCQCDDGIWRIHPVRSLHESSDGPLTWATLADPPWSLPTIRRR